MRNLFDQYDQPENRLTHALVSCLSKDKKLLRSFLKWILKREFPSVNSIKINEQQIPEVEELSEAEADKRGLPDAWMYDNENWSLILESKVSSKINIHQLNRHRNTALNRGFKDVTILVISVDESRIKLPKFTYLKKWSEIYSWLIKKSNESDWAKEIARYMEIAEGRMIDQKYLKEGTLTTFSGINFDEENPYNYQEAKRLLKLAMDKLRTSKIINKELNIDLSGKGRGAITGKYSKAVWDFLPVKKANEDSSRNPHFTFAIEQDRAIAVMTIPNRIKGSLRRNLMSGGDKRFKMLIGGVKENLRRNLSPVKGYIPWLQIVQRRYPTQKSAPIIDAKLEFDLRTSFTSKRNKNAVKIQKQWIDTTYQAFFNRKSNLQITVGVIFPYRTCKKCKAPEILDYVIKAWLSCKPVYDAIMK